jgi:hypothetical protein
MAKQISALGSVSFAWLHEQGGFAFDAPFFLNPEVRRRREQSVHEFVADRFPPFPVYNIEAHLVQIDGRKHPLGLVGGLQPNLLLAAALGAEFVFYGDKDPDVTPTPMAEVGTRERLEELDWSRTWPISLFLEQIGTMREAWGGTCRVIPPFFWDATGRATTHGIVTTAQKLIGDRVFLEMADRSAYVRQLFAWIADSYIRLVETFSAAADLPITGLHTGDCSVCMVGPDVFEELVLPPLNHMARRLGPVRLHSCGHSDHLLDIFSQVENLHCLNLGSNTSLARVRDRFGDVPVDLIPDLRLLSDATPRDVDAWVRRCLQENDGGPLQIQYHLDLGQREENCLQIHRTFEELGFGEARQEIY